MGLVDPEEELRFHYSKYFSKDDLGRLKNLLNRLDSSKSTKMRVTQHSGRFHRSGGTYSTKHNDRNFDSEAVNIIKNKTLNNTSWYWCQDKEPDLSFDEAELKFYEQRYGKQLSNTNLKYEQNYHKERIVTMDKWRKQKKHAPEEVIQQIGNVENNPGPDVLLKCWNRYLQEMESWNLLHGNHMHILDWSLHQDEMGAPHIHYRRTWDYFNSDTRQVEIGQEKALEAAGVQLPNPDLPPSRKNNRKMTFDKEMRILWINVCKEFGLDIESSPLPENEVGKTLNQKIRENEEKRKRQSDEVAAIVTDIVEEFSKQAAKLEEAQKEIEAEKEKLKSESEILQKQKNQIANEKKEWEQSEALSEEFSKKLDDEIPPLPVLENVSTIGTPEKLEANWEIEKKGTFSKESPFEYANRITNQLWDWFNQKFYEPLKNKSSKLLKAVKDLKKENFYLKNLNLELEKENEKIKDENKLINQSIDNIVEKKLKGRSEALLALGRAEEHRRIQLPQAQKLLVDHFNEKLDGDNEARLKITNQFLKELHYNEWAEFIRTEGDPTNIMIQIVQTEKELCFHRMPKKSWEAVIDYMVSAEDLYTGNEIVEKFKNWRKNSDNEFLAIIIKVGKSVSRYRDQLIDQINESNQDLPDQNQDTQQKRNYDDWGY